MTYAEVEPFLKRQHTGVVTTFGRDGAAQMSIVKCGAYEGGVVFVVRGNTAKLANLQRDPRCSVLTVVPDWSGYAVVAGRVELRTWSNTDPEQLRLELRDAFRACGGGEHPGWEEYDRVMQEERRAIVLVRPQRVYGFWRGASTVGQVKVE